MNGVWLVHDWPKALGTGNSPGKEGEGCSRRVVRFNGEQMANLVDREPEGGERTEPEEEKADKIHCVDAGARWDGVAQGCVAGPDGSDH